MNVKRQEYIQVGSAQRLRSESLKSSLGSARAWAGLCTTHLPERVPVLAGECSNSIPDSFWLQCEKPFVSLLSPPYPSQ